MANDIVDFLVNNKLILDAVMMEKVTMRKKGNDNQLVSENKTLIMGKTKSLLFNLIDTKLRERYKDDMPILYSVPIVNMDWDQANELIKETITV